MRPTRRFCHTLKKTPWRLIVLSSAWSKWASSSRRGSDPDGNVMRSDGSAELRSERAFSDLSRSVFALGPELLQAGELDAELHAHVS